MKNLRAGCLFLLGSLTAVGESAQKPERLPVGGQAVIEGVLMRGRGQWALAVRKEDGTLFEKVWPNVPWAAAGIWKLPILRGLATMAEMLTIGYKALALSAEVALGEDGQVSAKEMALTVGIALSLVMALFVAFPVWLTDRLCGQDWGNAWEGRILEGLIRAAVFIAYIAVIGLWKDMRRVFEYHGAEHKVINAYEAGLPMGTFRFLRSSSRFHLRCGTSFLLVIVAVSIVVFALAGNGSLFWRVGCRILLFPLVIGVAYEIIRGASSIPRAGKWLLFPTLWIQYLTTREPGEEQLAVARKALELALGNEAGKGSAPLGLMEG